LKETGQDTLGGVFRYYGGKNPLTGIKISSKEINQRLILLRLKKGRFYQQTCDAGTGVKQIHHAQPIAGVY
jgi:hypothetical protein